MQIIRCLNGNGGLYFIFIFFISWTLVSDTAYANDPRPKKFAEEKKQKKLLEKKAKEEALKEKERVS